MDVLPVPRGGHTETMQQKVGEKRYNTRSTFETSSTIVATYV
jgi:hypothetical protein